MEVTVTNTTRERVNVGLIKRAALATLTFGHNKGNVSVVIIGDQRMKTLNFRFRGRNSVTDVLSFTEAEAETQEKHFLGEIFIDYQVIKRQAKKFSPSLTYEWAFIVIHGVLHLLGYEDDTKAGAEKMEKLGQIIIKKVI